jgi:YegS/Rv2252/BmrU family lipid kinase
MTPEKKDKLLIILNPIAGKGKAITQYPIIEGFLKKNNQNYEIIKTTGTGHALEIAKTYPLAGDTAVVAAGGDGTCNEVANGLLTRKDKPAQPPLFGILPIGRGNDFSSSAGVPVEIEKALEMLIGRKIRPLDAGFVKGGFFPDGRYFVNGVGIGFDTKVGFEAAKMKHVHSGIAYALGAIITLVKFEKPPILEVTYGDTTVTHPSLIVSIMNGRRMGGSFFMGPNAKLDDGEMDVCIITKTKSRARLINIILHYPKGTQSECKETVMGRGKNIHIKAIEGGMAAHADGETVCLDGKELTISTLPSALRLIGA